MEFIPGESLASIASRKSDRRFTEAEVINYISKTCEALTYAHQQGVVHRDIKPSNIIILPGDHVKLADFGIAHIKEAATSRMNGGGTPVYMSPEQILNKETDARTDIYSLGVTMYEMLAGNPPFRGPEVRDDHVHAVPKPIPDATDWMNAIIMKCLKKEPAGRWINANELKDVLTRQKEIEVGFQTVFRPAWARAEDDRKMTPPATPSEKIVEKQVEPPPVRRVAVDRTPIRSSGAHKRVAPRPARTIPTHLAPEREQMRIGLGILVGFLAGLLFAGMASGGPSDGFNTILFQLSWIVYGGLIGIAIGIAQKRIVKGLLSFVLGTSGGLAAAFVGGLVTGFPSLDNWAAFPHSLLCGALVGAFIGIADGFYEMSFRYTFNCFLWGTLGGILAVAAFVVVRIVCSPVWTPAFAWIVMGAALGFFINLLIASVEKPVEESPRPYKDL
jgi:hypothetical protein